MAFPPQGSARRYNPLNSDGSRKFLAALTKSVGGYEFSASTVRRCSTAVIGPSRHFGAVRNLVAIGAKRASTKPRQSARVPFNSGLPLPKRPKEFSKAELRAQLAEAVRNT